jgi:hypothetical protein
VNGGSTTGLNRMTPPKGNRLTPPKGNRLTPPNGTRPSPGGHPLTPPGGTRSSSGGHPLTPPGGTRSSSGGHPLTPPGGNRLTPPKGNRLTPPNGTRPSPSGSGLPVGPGNGTPSGRGAGIGPAAGAVGFAAGAAGAGGRGIDDERTDRWSGRPGSASGGDATAVHRTIDASSTDFWADGDGSDDDDWEWPDDSTPAGTPPESTVPRPPSGPPPRRGGRLRYLVFALVFLLLLAAVPVLAYTGMQRLLDSRGGTTSSTSNSPTEPGFEAVVDKTPTALVIQTDPAGRPTALTLVALGRGDGGGTVIFVPFETALDRPKANIDRISTAYDPTKPDDYEGVIQATSSVLRISFTETIVVSDTRWADLVEPVAPLSLSNPDSVRSGDRSFASGPIELGAADIGPYLDARTRDDELEDNRLNRHGLLWQAWISKVKASGREDAIPGEVESGIGRFVATLAQGDAEYLTLPVAPVGEVPDRPMGYFPVPEAIVSLITEAVPFPFSAGAGERFPVRVLNGVKGEIVPTSVTDPLVANMAQIDVIGNARKFGQETTVIEYYDPANLTYAETARNALGGGEVKLREGVSEPYALTITIGADVLHALEAGGGTGVTVPGSVTSDPPQGGTGD